MSSARPRLAVRAAILDARSRVLMVNAWPGGRLDLWCLPGGGVEPGQSLPENLVREVGEETGLAIAVGAPVLVNEFHDPESGWHQVEIIFRASLQRPDAALRLQDPHAIVDRALWATREELGGLHHRPALLAEALWGAGSGALYDDLERILR